MPTKLKGVKLLPSCSSMKMIWLEHENHTTPSDYEAYLVRSPPY